MNTERRRLFNAAFSPEKHAALKQEFQDAYPDELGFRLSETPIFTDAAFTQKLMSVSDAIVEQLANNELGDLDRFIPEKFKVPNPTKRPHFLAVDFGICQNPNGELEPQLIELQAFPSLFAYQVFLVNNFKKHYPFMQDFNCFLGVADEQAYFAELKKLILADEPPEHVILMELYPDKQKTKIDFSVTRDYLGIPTICYTQIKKEGRKLYYEKDGKRIRIKRIYNRFIFDDFDKYPDIQSEFRITDEVDVEWITHPNWFYKISKALSPLLKHEFIPEAFFVKDFPENKLQDLDQYVLKPLFSYAGQGVVLSPSIEQVQSIPNKADYILQKRVQYAKVFPDINGEMATAEIRLLYIWQDDEARPKPLISLVRMTKSAMINVDHNTGEKIWTGSSVAFFE